MQSGDADGSLRDFLEWKNSDLLTCNGAAFVVDYSQVRRSGAAQSQLPSAVAVLLRHAVHCPLSLVFCIAQDEKLKTARLDFVKLRQYEEVRL